MAATEWPAMASEPVSRRRALALLGLGGMVMAAGGVSWMSCAAGEPGGGGALAQPQLLTSRDGLLEVTLTAAPGTQLAGRKSSAWAYNGASPGPTLRVKAGDLLRVKLVNNIDQPTNLHTHGLHVSPQANSDNPFVTVAPGSSFDYTIAVPADHPPGTYWYHPHHHGTVADQIFAGLAGALLVQNGPDLPVDDDISLLVTDITLDGAGNVIPPNPMARMAGREGELVLVNGQYQPVVTASPGTAQRWRIINGCVSRVLDLRLEGHRLTQIALDGVFLPAPAQHDRLVLAPGNRADLLVRPADSGRYALISEPYDRGGLGMMGDMMNGGPAARGPVTLATLHSRGPAATPPPLPATLPAPPVPPDTVTARRQITFAMGMGMGFTIDGRSFDPDRDDQRVQLDTIEEWAIVNSSTMDHPFHLHAWPFHVLTPPGTSPAAVRQDVVLVPAGGSVRLRIPFTDFAGRSVYHCHILDHEDLGMMATVNVSA
ncbi:copper oxidase [Catellatospora sp. IY07-71]|uniref:multicopper oxidase family protein n=1 Tax=Catellatospora sp. IY07-71 TaxID=2728827 RepID=UPI001BB4561B|nr:multicopper oxidase family protein [Catellatospora sp. IY07-71]BCJ75866.1 copper oxidase [Catellatospora sp. IY07-71]